MSVKTQAPFGIQQNKMRPGRDTYPVPGEWITKDPAFGLVRERAHAEGILSTTFDPGQERFWFLFFWWWPLPKPPGFAFPSAPGGRVSHRVTPGRLIKVLFSHRLMVALVLTKEPPGLRVDDCF
jgi:hypothetical protein